LDHNTTPNSDSLEDNLIDSSEVDLVEIEQEIAQLSQFVSSDPALLGGEDVAELLQRLTNAETMAEGMENKINSVLQNLDDLLGLLDHDSVANEEKSTAVAGENDEAANSETQNEMQPKADSSSS